MKKANVNEKYHTLNNTNTFFERFSLAPSRTIFWLIEYIILGDSAIWSNHKTRHAQHSIANSSLFPTSLYLHSNSTQILAIKKWFFWKKIKNQKKENIYIFS